MNYRIFEKLLNMDIEYVGSHIKNMVGKIPLGEIYYTIGCWGLTPEISERLQNIAFIHGFGWWHTAGRVALELNLKGLYFNISSKEIHDSGYSSWGQTGTACFEYACDDATGVYSIKYRAIIYSGKEIEIDVTHLFRDDVEDDNFTDDDTIDLT